MVQFTNTPPEADRPKNLKLLRTPIKNKLSGIITSNDIIGCSTHWYGGRTTPCEAPDCPACNDGAPSRWHGYLTLWFPNDCVQILYEFTDSVAPILTQYRTEHGTLRGARLDASRSKPVPNGRVILKVTRIDHSQWKLPDPPDLMAILLRMWEMPLKCFEAKRKFEGAPQITTQPEALDRYHGRLGKNGSKPTAINDLLEATTEAPLPRDLRGPFDKAPKPKAKP